MGAAERLQQWRFKWVVGASEHQRIDGRIGRRLGLQGRHIALAQRLGEGFIAPLDGVGQSVAGLTVEMWRVLCARVFKPGLQFLEADAGQRAARGHDADVAGATERHRGLEGRLHTDEGQVVVGQPQGVDGVRRGRVAGDDHGIERVLAPQLSRDALRALDHLVGVAFAVGREGAVGDIDETCIRDFDQQGAQHAQAAHPAVKNPNSVAGGVQALATVMPLNSPDAMRLLHSAGPVMWALVPPASTATVTGMSTTSNS